MFLKWFKNQKYNKDLILSLTLYKSYLKYIAKDETKNKKEDECKLKCYETIDEKKKDSINKKFWNYQFITNYNQCTLAICFSFLIVILCNLQWWHLWFPFIQNVKHILSHTT